MGDHLKKVQPGQPLRMPAAAYNAFVDAARDFQSRQRDQGQQPKPSPRQSGIVLVKNTSGADRDRFSILGLDDNVIGPGDNLEQFKNRVCFKGVVPTLAHVGAFAVLLEPLKENAIGLAFVDGVCAVKVQVTNVTHWFADVRPGYTSHLLAGPTGSAGILWKESGTGEKWAVVRLASHCPLDFRYICDKDDPVVGDLSSLRFLDFDFLIWQSGNLGEIGNVAWKGFYVESYPDIRCNGVKALEFDGFWQPVGPNEMLVPVAFTITCQEVTEEIDGCTVIYNKPFIEGSVVVPNGVDEKVKVTADDGVAGFLDEELLTDDKWLSKAVENPNANEKLRLSHIGPDFTANDQHVELHQVTKSGTLDITVNFTAYDVHRDERGHIEVGEDSSSDNNFSINPYHVLWDGDGGDAPGVMGNKIRSADYWIVFTAPDRSGVERGVKIGHNTPSTAAKTASVVTDVQLQFSDKHNCYDPWSYTLTVSKADLKIDDKGHVLWQYANSPWQ